MSARSELAAGVERLRLALDPALAELKREHDEAEAERAYDRHLARKYKGSRGGGQQCAGCKQLRPLGEIGCGNCGYMDRGGYQSVPAKTSYLERWR